MRRLDERNTANAIKRNYARRLTVSLARREGARATIEARCPDGHTHAVAVERRGSALYVECYFADTGEVCPSDQGGKVCYHETAAAGFYLALEAQGAFQPDVRRAQQPAAARPRAMLTRDVLDCIGPYMN